MRTPQELARDVIEKGGCIVCTEECSEMEIALARSCGRMAVFEEDGCGIIRRPKEWLEMAKMGAKEESLRRLALAAGLGTIAVNLPQVVQ